MESYMPVEIDDFDNSMNLQLSEMMPSKPDIPKEFWFEGNPYNDFVSGWFFGGADSTVLLEKSGINKEVALRHIQSLMISREISQSHKIAGISYLLSLWFNFK